MDRLDRAKQILEKLESYGYQAYLVGGCVRDLLLGRPLGDIDICTSAMPEEVTSLFDRTIPTGIKHGTVTVVEKGQTFEVTTFRVEQGYRDYRRPDQVRFVQSLRQDLARRDFTVNAIAMDKRGQLFDYFGGLRDLQLRLIRTVGVAKERFQEDALRMVRALRFSSQLGFTIDKAIFKAIEKHAGLLHEISRERITAELRKMVLGDDLNLGLKLLVGSKLMLCQPFKLLEPALQQAQTFNFGPLTELERWAVLLYPLSKAERTSFLNQLRLPNSFVKPLIRLINLLDLKPHCTQVNQLDVLDPLEWSASELLSLLKINQLKTERRLANDLSWQLEAYLKRLPLRSPQDLAINGYDLQLLFKRPPGPWIRDMLSKVMEMVQRGHLPNRKEMILSYLLERENYEPD